MAICSLKYTLGAKTYTASVVFGPLDLKVIRTNVERPIRRLRCPNLGCSINADSVSIKWQSCNIQLWDITVLATVYMRKSISNIIEWKWNMICYFVLFLTCRSSITATYISRTWTDRRNITRIASSYIAHSRDNACTNFTGGWWALQKFQAFEFACTRMFKRNKMSYRHSLAQTATDFDNASISGIYLDPNPERNF